VVVAYFNPDLVAHFNPEYPAFVIHVIGVFAHNLNRYFLEMGEWNKKMMYG
jgi:hypothetical protein